MAAWIDSLLSGRIVEFSYQGKHYLIQQENNKGWNYLSLWRTEPDSVCLGRAFFDIFDGVSMDTIRDLCSQPCLEGRTLWDVMQESDLAGEAKQNEHVPR